MSSLKCLPVPTIKSHVPKYNNWSNYSKNLSLSGRIRCTEIKSNQISLSLISKLFKINTNYDMQVFILTLYFITIHLVYSRDSGSNDEYL